MERDNKRYNVVVEESFEVRHVLTDDSEEVWKLIKESQRKGERIVIHDLHKKISGGFTFSMN